MPPLAPVKSIPARAPLSLIRMTGKRNGSHQDRHHPKFEGIDGVSGIDWPIGKNGQNNDCHRQQDEGSPQLEPG